MKLATYKDDTRDGQLVVVSRDLRQAHFATSIATRLQVVLDDWNFMAPQLEALSTSLNQGRSRHAFAFDPALCMAPLPRAFHCVAAWPRSAQHVPGDGLLGAADDLPWPDGDGERVAFPALVACTGDLPQGATREQVLSAARLHMLGQLVMRRSGPGALPSAPALLGVQPRLAFSPVAVTPDEWPSPRSAKSGARSDAPRGELLLGWRDDAGAESEPRRVAVGGEAERSLTALIGEASRSRELRAGSLFAVAVETAEATGTQALHSGGRLRVEFFDGQGASVFGAIDLGLSAPGAAEAQN